MQAIKHKLSVSSTDRLTDSIKQQLTGQCNAMQCSAVQCWAVPYCAVQFLLLSTVRVSRLLGNRTQIDTRSASKVDHGLKIPNRHARPISIEGSRYGGRGANNQI